MPTAREGGFWSIRGGARAEGPPHVQEAIHGARGMELSGGWRLQRIARGCSAGVHAEQ